MKKILAFLLILVLVLRNASIFFICLPPYIKIGAPDGVPQYATQRVWPMSFSTLRATGRTTKCARGRT